MDNLKQKHSYLQGFINQFEEGYELQELSNNDWTVSHFLKWLQVNDFEIIKNRKKGVSTGPSKKRKEVEQFDLDGNFIRTWESITKVEKELKIYNINAVCKGKQETAGGYKWEYKIKENE